MVRLISAVIGVSLWIGVGEIAVKATYQMAAKAKHAFVYEQLSYEKFTHQLIEAKPRHAYVKASKQ